MIVVEIAQEREFSISDLLLANLINWYVDSARVRVPIYYTTQVEVSTHTPRAKKVNSPYLPDYGCVIYRSK